MRLFIAIHLPESVTARIHRIAQPLRTAGLPLRWVPPENHHLTLAFLGEVDPDRIVRIDAAMARATGGEPRFEVELGHLRIVPTRSRPRMLWIAVADCPALQRLHGRLVEALQGEEFPVEARAFRPHLTLARVRRGKRPRDLASLPALAAKLDFSATVPVRSVQLMRSELTGQGARYEEVSRCMLGRNTASQEA